LTALWLISDGYFAFWICEAFLIAKNFSRAISIRRIQKRERIELSYLMVERMSEYLTFVSDRSLALGDTEYGVRTILAKVVYDSGGSRPISFADSIAPWIRPG
jgi:hypothetical protein